MAQRPEGKWDAEGIRAEVRRRFGTLSALAAKSGYTLTAICYAIKGETFVPGPCKAVAKAIGQKPHTLWPHWFNRDGTPLQGRDASDDKKSSPCGSRRNAQRSGAA